MPEVLNAAERVARLLREELLSGHYEPGERLKEEELAARFGIGRYTVRAALRALVASGMLDLRANRGARVPKLTHERVADLCDHREVLEVGALRLALRHGADLSGAVTAIHALQRLHDDAAWVDVVVTHHRIHREIVASTGNERLLQAYGQCEEEIRYVVSTVRPDYTARRLADHHVPLLNEIERGGNAAVDALERPGAWARGRAHRFGPVQAGSRIASHVGLKPDDGLRSH